MNIKMSKTTIRRHRGSLEICGESITEEKLLTIKINKH